MRALILVLLTCELCSTIRVPVVWDDNDSENQEKNDYSEEIVETNPRGQEEEYVAHPFVDKVITQKPIPAEYFEYASKKPQFAVDNAAYHGVQSPENYYKAYPIHPYTGSKKPQFGKHQVYNSRNKHHKESQELENTEENGSEAAPVSSSYEVYHPYEEETPALKTIYKDPVLMKIRNDLENSKNRLQQYETDTGNPNISKEEYLERPEKTEQKLFPPREHAPYEIHRPQRRPIYYRQGPVYKTQGRILLNRLKHPWNNNIAKVQPAHYRPLQNHIKNLRYGHAIKYDDEGNEYPQVTFAENHSDPKDGLDIYQRGHDKFNNIRNTVDETINGAVQNNRPKNYGKLEIQKDDSSANESNDEDEEEIEFVPIKNYAQVRKTETYKHLPRQSALDEAETYDEIKNAPRLKEAVKSTKAQTVYSEEGYEDAAYDHAGEHKHASENEGHGGFLKEHSLSAGKYKSPSLSTNYDYEDGSNHKDQSIHASKWKDDNENIKEQASKEEDDKEEYADENEHSIETNDDNDENYRSKREHNADLNSTHIVDKRETNFEVPEIDLNSTFLNDKDLIRIYRLKIKPGSNVERLKYPYYFKKLKSINKSSPLRYAENLKHIPKKSNGGTEFYDSRSKFQCPDVDDVPDPIPEKLKGEGHPDDDNDETDDNSSPKDDQNFDTVKKQPRLKGLGDKIDCFKAKYFGENPLDSPFFKEGIIRNPEPLRKPNIASFTLKPDISDQIRSNVAESNIFDTYNDLHGLNHTRLNTSIKNLNLTLNPQIDSRPFHDFQATNSNIALLEQQSKVYNDIIKNIKIDLIKSDIQVNKAKTNNETNPSPSELNKKQELQNITYMHFNNKEDILKPVSSRTKRAAPIFYEPYKIIRDGLSQDTIRKLNPKTNANPHLRHSRASTVNHKDFSPSDEETSNEKRSDNIKSYKNIGKTDRVNNYGSSKNDRSDEDSDFVVINVDKRRSEPRYEVKHKNHKPSYMPVLDRKAMSKEDYEAQINDNNGSPKNNIAHNTNQRRRIQSTHPPVYDITQFIPKVKETSNKKNITPTKSNSKREDILDDHDGNEEENYEDENEKTTTRTTLPISPPFKRKARIDTITEKPVQNPKLRLVTRLRDYKPTMQENDDENEREKTEKKNFQHHDSAPKIKEKKKKLSKSTIVTDAKTYGNISDSDGDRMRAEVDKLIGIKHDMDDYLPLYENESKNESDSSEVIEEDSKENESKEVRDSREIDENSEEEVDEDDEDYSTEDEEESEEEDIDEDEIDEETTNDENKSLNQVSDENTTSEPTKRTLDITTEVPSSTVATRYAKIQSKPTIIKKVIKIHNELPMVNLSPNISQFKQDIQEIEIIKERNPLKRKPNKNVEVLDLYKDENLAKDINNMGVEIFKENLNLRQGPRHGGNYKILQPNSERPSKNNNPKTDTETSQSEQAENINLKANKEEILNKSNRAKISKLIELRDSPHMEMHGGNLKHRTEKYKADESLNKSHENIELDDDDDVSEEEDKAYNSRGNTRMHGGNYLRPTEESSAVDAKGHAEIFLSSLIQAAPVLTTTPRFIADPSKRKYYYVDI